jgi:hypothetical protein
MSVKTVRPEDVDALITKIEIEKVIMLTADGKEAGYLFRFQVLRPARKKLPARIDQISEMYASHALATQIGAEWMNFLLHEGHTGLGRSDPRPPGATH